MGAPTKTLACINPPSECKRAGSAYVFERSSDGTWSETTRLKASSSERGDEFGLSVSISGDRVAVGANHRAAYVFERASDGTWNETAILKTSDGYENDDFGSPVSISGQHTIVSMWNANGAVYIFE